MTKRISAGVAAGVVALALSVPSIGFANKGGVPHSTTACPTHSHKGAGHGKNKGAGKGKKCGTK